MKQPIRPLQLTDLRKSGFAYFDKAHSTNNGFFQIGPRRQVKVYGRPTGRWIYRPKSLSVYRSLRTAELPEGQSHKTLEELFDEMESSLSEFALRARKGNNRAATLLVEQILRTIQTLDHFADAKVSSIVKVAEHAQRWPASLTMNPKDVQRSLDRIKSLNVGSKSLTPTRPGHRVDFASFWTALTHSALNACNTNRRMVPAIRKFGEGANKIYRRQKYFGTQVSATIYKLADDSLIIIADWQATCATLPTEITKSNSKKWWKALKGCVLEFWWAHKKKYQEALNKIGNPAESEARRRNLAISEVRQAFESLVGTTVHEPLKYRMTQFP